MRVNLTFHLFYFPLLGIFTLLLTFYGQIVFSTEKGTLLLTPNTIKAESTTSDNKESLLNNIENLNGIYVDSDGAEILIKQIDNEITVFLQKLPTNDALTPMSGWKTGDLYFSGKLVGNKVYGKIPKNSPLEPIRKIRRKNAWFDVSRSRAFTKNQ